MGRVPSDVCTLQKRQNRRVLPSPTRQGCGHTSYPPTQARCALLRCRPLSGYEPRRLYNVVEFLMNDKDDSGAVSVEEVMGILYLRYGRQLLDSVRPEAPALPRGVPHAATTVQTCLTLLPSSSLPGFKCVPSCSL